MSSDEREQRARDVYRQHRHTEPSAATLAAMLAYATERESAVASDAWQPIETAPRDARILGFMPNRVEGGRPYVAVIFWDDEFRSDGWNDEADEVAYVGGWSAGRVGSFSYEEYAEERPTHWMPLPAPPIAGDQ